MGLEPGALGGGPSDSPRALIHTAVDQVSVAGLNQYIAVYWLSAGAMRRCFLKWLVTWTAQSVAAPMGLAGEIEARDRRRCKRIDDGS